MSSSRLSITRLLDSVATGDRRAADDLFMLVYEELKRIAADQMNREANQTLQSTALVHEVWLKLIGKENAPQWNGRRHFFAAAAQAMRRILVDAARARKRKKRGGSNVKVQLREDDWVTQSDDDLIALDEALEIFGEQEPVKAKLVNLRYFGGLTNQQAAEQLEISTATAERYWTYAKAWLRAKIES
jgi:RNA polymerase sigma factor (TIGR02999 family)